jgi:alpha-D-ribose 1-methylphosphonate 5-triphosphate synthase subunit PhnH
MNSAPTFKHWGHGFDDPATGSQRTFRAIFAAMVHPGQIVTIHENPDAPDVFNSASAATCLTLLDYETPVWTDIDWISPAISWLQFDCESSVVTEPCMANFAIVTKPASMPDLDYFRVDRHEYHEKATTLIIQVDDILPRASDKNSNIFFEKTAQLEFKGVPDKFWDRWQYLSGLYPLGIDIFFTCDDVLIALPKINIEEGAFDLTARISN